MAGYLTGCDATFANAANQVSAHVGIGLDGTIHEYVHDEDVAWANGRLEEGNHWPGPVGINPNHVTISCETEDRANNDEPVTPEQYRSVLAWGKAMTAKYPSIRFLLSHGAISPHTRPHCPGNRWSESGLLDRLASDLGLELVV